MRRKIVLLISLLIVCSCVFAETLQHTINSQWKFKKQLTDEDSVDINELNTKDWESVCLPHTWNSDDTQDIKYGWFRGTGWYVKSLNLRPDAARNLYLHFEAASLVTKVWVNGQSAGKEHIGGYTPFCYNISPFIKSGLNTIVVKVNNAHNEDVNPLSADFNFYGGIYRDVSLIYKGDVHFNPARGNGVFIKSTDVNQERATITINSDIINTKSLKKFKLVHSIFDSEGKLLTDMKGLSIKNLMKDVKLTLKNPHLWNTDDPYLYTVVSTIYDKDGNIVDEVRNPLGIRTYRFDPDKGFFLNGKHLKLIGVNRHQDHKNFGNALTDEMHRRDMKLMKDLGVNCFRISHYPHDPAVLEYCDKYGFICFEEIPIVNRINTTQTFAENCKSQIKEMIERDYNHPSIVAWNSSNEITVPHPKLKKWTKEQADFYKNTLRDFLEDLKNYIHKLDPTRTTMIVHCYTPKQNASLDYHQAELIGYNKYLGWYEGKVNGLNQFFRDFKKEEPNKTLFMSEFGAGADVRIHSFHPTQFDHSEEYQVHLFKEQLKAIRDAEHVAGGTIWGMVDFYSEFRVDAIPNLNEKGLMTSDRKPKASYYYLKTFLSKKPYLVIPTKLWTKRGGIEDKTGSGICTQKVEVFANTPSVELIHNGVSLGYKDVIDCITTFDVPFVKGTNRLVLRYAKNEEVIEDFMDIDFELQPFLLNHCQGQPFKAISINNGSYCYINDLDRGEQLWYPDRPYTEGSWGYIGGKYFKRTSTIFGTNKNIVGTHICPLYQTQLVGIKEYMFDVADGTYELSLGFAELTNEKRIFSVKVNGKTIIKDLNLKNEYGLFKAVNERFTIACRNNEGIKVEFISQTGEPVLNNISLRRVY